MAKPKTQKILRCLDSDEEDSEVMISGSTKSKPSASESAKPKAKGGKQQIIPSPAESDDEDEEAESESEDEEESDDDQTNSKKPVKVTSLANSRKKPVKTVKKQTSSKKSSKKRATDSDDEVIHSTTTLKKPRTKAASSSSRKKQPVQVIDSEDDFEDDSEDDSEEEIIELTKKSTKSKPMSKPKTSQKQPTKASKFTPTKKQIFQTSTDPESEDEAEEADSSEDEVLPKITLTERKGDLFAAPPNTLLVHACNCVGSWNAGIALAFQKNYPQAYAVYQAHCASRTPNSLLSTCLIIPPQSGAQYQHWIACLFTSKKYGRGKDSKEAILDSTDSALQDMLEQFEELKKKPKGVWMCKINSGSFKVPWMQTKKLIEALTFKGGLQIDIVDKK